MSRFDPSALAAWCGGDWMPGPPPTISGLVHNSKAVEPGTIFVAIRGARFDGHAFLAAAIKAGAVGAVVDRAFDSGADPAFPLLRVDDTQVALQALAQGHRRTLTGTIVGVTGSVGKTTVKEMLATALAVRGPVARTRGNWNNEIGMPLSVLDMRPEDAAGVFEIGMNRPGEIARLCTVLRPDCGLVTPIGPAHGEFFSGIDAIAAEKSALLLALPREGMAVIDAESPYAGLFREASAAPVVTVSTGASGDIQWTAENDGRVRLRDVQSGTEAVARLPVPGRHNALNAALAAAMACRRFELPVAVVARQLERCVLPSMRWQELAVHGVRVINDAYNANPLSMRAAIETFAATPTPGARWLVLGDMLELGPEEVDAHEALGRYLAEHDWAGLVTVGRLGAAIAAGARAGGYAVDRVVASPTDKNGRCRAAQGLARPRA